MDVRNGLVGIVLGLTLGCANTSADISNQVTFEDAKNAYSRIESMKQGYEGYTPSEAFIDSILVERLKTQEPTNFVISGQDYKSSIDKIGDLITANLGLNTQDITSRVPETIGFGILTKSPKLRGELKEYALLREQMISSARMLHKPDAFWNVLTDYTTSMHRLVINTSEGTATQEDLQQFQILGTILKGFSEEIEQRGINPKIIDLTETAVIDFYKDSKTHSLVYDTVREKILVPDLSAGTVEQYIRTLKNGFDQLNSYFLGRK